MTGESAVVSLNFGCGKIAPFLISLTILRTDELGIE